MSLGMLNRFRNELLILLAIIFVLSAYMYKISSKNFVESKRYEISKSIQDINQIGELKKLWKSKGISKKAIKLKTLVSKDKVKFFKKSSGKVEVSYKNLNTKELNMIIKHIMNNPFRISKLKISKEAKESYSMELVCRW